MPLEEGKHLPWDESRWEVRNHPFKDHVPLPFIVAFRMKKGGEIWEIYSSHTCQLDAEARLNNLRAEAKTCVTGLN